MLGACVDRAHPDPFVDPVPDAGGSGGSGFIDAGFHDGPPDPDAAGLCGNDIVPVLIDRPNLYFVLDRSGSMTEPIDSVGGSDKYTSARQAIFDVLKAIGHRVSYGATVFPAFGDGCGSGQQVFETQPGDPASYAQAGDVGPVLFELNKVLAQLFPEGGTPTSAALAAVRPTLLALPGKTVVVLLTDGAPNCNALAICDAAHCMLNMAGATVGGKDCDDSFNCCDPANVPGGPLQCLDTPASVDSLAVLAAASIPTYVLGMPGSGPFAAALDLMAEAGGTALSGSQKYYRVDDTEQLADAVRQIGTGVAISCTVDLAETPPDASLVNVYLDTSLVKQDEKNGWSWVDEDTLELHGAACDTLKSGDVFQVQVVAGCPTFVP